MRIITAASGVIMVLTSAWCFMHTGNTFLSLAFIIGVAMMIQAFGGICAYIGARNEFSKSSWILSQAIATGLLAIVVLCNMLNVDGMITIIVSMWCMFSGLQQTVASAHMMRSKEEGWIIPLALGAVALVAGFYGFFNAVLLALSNIMLVTIFLLVQGANVIAIAVNMPGKYKIFPHDHIFGEKEKPEPDFTFEKGGAKKNEEDEEEIPGVIKPESTLPDFAFSDVSAKIDDAAEEAAEDTTRSIAEDISEVFDEEREENEDTEEEEDDRE